MKRSLLVLVFVRLAVALHAQSPAAEVRALLLEQQAAWNRGDLLAFMDGYWHSDSLLFVGSNGPTYGWEQTLANYQHSYPGRAGMGQLSFDFREFRVLGPDLVFVLGGWKLTREKDAPAGFFTLLVRRIEGRWRIIADHSS